MRQSWCEVPCRVYGITGGSTQGHTQRNYEHCNGKGSERAHSHFGRVAVGRQGEDYENQHAGSDDLTEQVAAVVPDGRYCAECREFGRRVIGDVVMVLVIGIHEYGTDKTSAHLGNYTCVHKR